MGRWMKDADKDRLASLVRRIAEADQMDQRLKQEKESAEARERQRREDMVKNWQNAFQCVADIVHELNPQLSPRGLTLAVEGSGNISGAIGRITIIVAAGTPIVHKSMALNLAQTGTVQLVYTGVVGRPAGAAFELDKFDRDAFTDLIFRFLEAVIAEREQAQLKRQSEMGADKPEG
jgi:hypothetical protein